ncbi:YjbF family lipoprotein [Vibrio hippocampi]|uniref:Lipoprotein GfcB n=1 Tax=Vibrio hippocampi TaxID=654686 RepID=A0ABM8ZKB6_9VIBR|nr:YjbF family lipoprotein [Vibrio hippocampi]CAH0527242.1 putative lipoprotein GfcB [Vibrio hippocampi]
MKTKRLVLSLSLLLLTACSQRFQDVNATFSHAFYGPDDAVLTAEQISDLPYASTYVRINDGAQIFMVLAFAQQNPLTGYTQYKWMSSDRAMIVTEQGRIVKTLGLLGDNLVGLERKAQTNTSWSVTYDWSPQYRYGYNGIAIQTALTQESISTPLQNYNTRKYAETVSFDAIDAKITNYYWKDIVSNQVIKQIEYIGPQMHKIEMTLLKAPTI